MEASAKAISNIKFDKIVVWEGGGAKGERRICSERFSTVEQIRSR